MLLYEQHCDTTIKPQRLKDSDIQSYLKQVPEWNIEVLPEKDNSAYLLRRLKFTNYTQTLQFINSVAKIVDEENHHPDISFGYNNCSIAFITHSACGITLFDFICAAHIDQLVLKNN